MTKDEALKLALEALEGALSDDKPYIVKCKVALDAIQEALAQPAQESDDIAARMSVVADEFAHKMALDLECILYEYSGKWYDAALNTLEAYRTAMRDIHESVSPTHMGEPVLQSPDWIKYAIPPNFDAAQPAQEIDWKDQYEYQKRRAEMWIAKYEKDIGPLEKVFLAAQPRDEISALKQRIQELENELIGCKEIIATQDAVLEAQAEYVNDLQDQIVDLEGED